MRKVYTGYHVTSEIEQGRCACTVDNTLAKARGLSLRTGALARGLSTVQAHKPCSISHAVNVDPDKMAFSGIWSVD